MFALLAFNNYYRDQSIILGIFLYNYSFNCRPNYITLDPNFQTKTETVALNTIMLNNCMWRIVVLQAVGEEATHS